MLQVATAGLLSCPALDLKAPSLEACKAIFTQLYTKGIECCDCFEFLHSATLKWRAQDPTNESVSSGFKKAFRRAPSALQAWIDETGTRVSTAESAGRREAVETLAPALIAHGRLLFQEMTSACLGVRDLMERLKLQVPLPENVFEKEPALSTSAALREYLGKARRAITHATDPIPVSHEPASFRYQEFLQRKQRLAAQFQEWRESMRDLTSHAVGEIDKLLEPTQFKSLTNFVACIAEDSRFLLALGKIQSLGDLQYLLKQISASLAHAPQVVRASIENFPVELQHIKRLGDWIRKTRQDDTKLLMQTLAPAENALRTLAQFERSQFVPNAEIEWPRDLKDKLLVLDGDWAARDILNDVKTTLLYCERRLAASATRHIYDTLAAQASTLRGKNAKNFEKVLEGWSRPSRTIRSVEDHLDLLAFRITDLKEQVEPSDPILAKVKTMGIDRAQFQKWSLKWLCTGQYAIDRLNKLLFSSESDLERLVQVVRPNPEAPPVLQPAKPLTPAIPVAPALPPVPAAPLPKSVQEVARERDELAAFIKPYDLDSELRIRIIQTMPLQDVRNSRAVLVEALGGVDGVADDLIRANPQLLLGDNDREFGDYLRLISSDQVIGAIGAMKLAGSFKAAQFASLRALHHAMRDAQAISELREGIRRCCDLLSEHGLDHHLGFVVAWGALFFRGEYVRTGTKEEFWHDNLKHNFGRTFNRKEVNEQIRRLRQPACGIFEEAPGSIILAREGTEWSKEVVRWVRTHRPYLPAALTLDDLLPDAALDALLV